MLSIGDYIRSLSVRRKLLALVMLPLLLLAGTVIYLTALWSTSYTYKQLFAKVNTDLRVTHNVFQRIQHDREVALSALADSSAFLAQLQANNASGVIHLLERQKVDDAFDFVNLLNSDGSARWTPYGWGKQAMKVSPLTDSMFGDASLNTPRESVTGIEIYSRQDWEAESEALAVKAILPLIDPPRAAPSDKTHEERAMVIRVLTRVRGSDGTELGVLEGGLLLNHNYAFVDEIRDLVYGPGSLAEGSRGTVTVFLDDVRITTNVPDNADARALGTRVSVEVRNTVLEQGGQWIDRAFVVNDWYISAYEPIVDVYNKRVGMLYAGYLEAPFRSDMYRAVMGIAAVVLAGSLLAVLVAISGAKSIFKPVESIARVVRATAAGEYQRIGDLRVHDEIGELATQFDSMLDTLEEHSAQIKANANELEHKVQERTAELKQKNISLQESITMLHEAQQKLATAERLAAVGQLTAGVAHEINNPTAVILGNMDILIQEMGEQREGVQTEIDLIIEQVYRIRSITDRLLQYSRPNSTAPLKDHELLGLSAYSPDAQYDDMSPMPTMRVGVNDLIESSSLLVKHDLALKNIALVKTLSPVPNVLIDKQELQQVIVNLLLNASQAILNNGLITISTFVGNDGQVCIAVEDNGVGIELDNMPQLFDPFFTFGKVGGTGLGLSVSYGIVKRYEGDIKVDSSIGDGATFTVTLPIDNVDVQQHNAAII